MIVASEGDPAQALELLQVRVKYEREIGHPDAENHAKHIQRIQQGLRRKKRWFPWSR